MHSGNPRKEIGSSAPFVLLCVAACAPASSGGGGPSVELETLGGSILVDWAPVTDASAYRVFGSTTLPIDLASAPSVTVVAPPFAVANLTGTYHVVVQALLPEGAGPPSAPATVVVAPAAPERYFPSWAGVTPTNVLTIDYDAGQTSIQNGLRLESLLNSLLPGDEVRVGGGTWASDGAFRIDVRGTASAPIWITAQSGETPIITRFDANQNALELGTGGGARYLCLRGLEITGGDIAVRLHDCQNVWLDQCHVHDCPQNAIAANSHAVDALYFTQNEVHGTGGTGEGFYIGGNNGNPIASRCVIALNHVYDCGGFQGDGIEVKQGSWGNWIVENTVHDTNYPCILVYGTGGRARNVIERNVCWSSGDNVMQVQGEAVVRNNALFDGLTAFHSGDHQGQTRDLTVVNNTFVNEGRAVNLSDWGGRGGLVFANNACYSRTSNAIQLSGATGVTFTGNVAYGPVQGIGSGYVSGAGLADFLGASWDGSSRDVTPRSGSALDGAAVGTWVPMDQLDATLRLPPYDVGAGEND